MHQPAALRLPAFIQRGSRLIGVRLVGWRPNRTISCLLALVSLALPACREKPTGAAGQTAASASTGNEPERGTQVVFEKVAGEFIEGTVLERKDDRLRVQTHDGQASLNLTTAGVYPLSHARLESKQGSYAVCGTAPRRWQGCKVEHANGAHVEVVTQEAERQTLNEARVLAISSLSQMNVKRAFDRATKHRVFERDLARAGAPVAPPDWRPHAGERVIALRKAEWYTAHIHEFEKDGGIRVRFRSDGEVEKLERMNIIPEPPYRRTIERGDFALLRPQAESQPWIAVKVRAVATDDGRQFKVQDINDEIREVAATALVPLSH